MALYKEIRQNDGVVTKYHRISFIQVTTNRQNSIAVFSYVDNEARTDEINSVIAEPYVKSITYETVYDETMTIESAYEYLKTLPQFEGATDI